METARQTEISFKTQLLVSFFLILLQSFQEFIAQTTIRLVVLFQFQQFLFQLFAGDAPHQLSLLNQDSEKLMKELKEIKEAMNKESLRSDEQ